LVKLLQRSVDITIDEMISVPPIVGVPAFLWWASGPSFWIYCPTCISLNFLMTHGPRRKQIKKAVRLA